MKCIRGIGRHWCWLVMGIVLVSGCRESDDVEPRAAPVQSTAAKRTTVPSDEESRRFAEEMAKAARDGDSVVFERLVDYDKMLNTATQGVPGVEETRRNFMAGAKEQLQEEGGLAAKVIPQVAQDGRYDLLRIVSIDGMKRVRFRLLSGDGGIDYHDWIVVMEPDGSIKAVDVLVLSVGELFTETFHRLFLPFAHEASKSPLRKLTQWEDDYIRHFDKIGTIIACLQGGQYRQALDVYTALPLSLKKERVLLLMRMKAAAGLKNDREYANAVTDFQRFHPNDPSFLLRSLRYHVLRDELDKALACLIRLDKAVGGDPYLAFLQAQLHSAKGEWEAARSLAQKAIQDDPSLEGPYGTLLQVSLAQKNFDETNRVLKKLEETFQTELADFTQVPMFADYIKSPQYQQWLKQHQTTKKPTTPGAPTQGEER